VALELVLAPAQAVPLAVFGSLPSTEEMALSPDGSRIAFVRTDQDKRMLGVLSLADGKLLGGGPVGDTKLRSIEWADNNRLIITTSSATQPLGTIGSAGEWFLLQVYDLRTRKLEPIPDSSLFRDRPMMNTVFTAPQVRHVNGHAVLFVTGAVLEGLSFQPALIQADLDGTGERLLRVGNERTREWLVDETGQLAAETTYYEQGHHWELQVQRERHLQKVTESHEPIDVPEILGFGPSPDTLLMATVEDGNPVWRLVSLKDGTVGPPMAERASLSSPIEDRETHRMIGGVQRGDAPRYVFFDPALQKHWDAIVRAFPDEHVGFVSASADFQKIIVLVDGVRDGYCYQLVDLGTHHATLLAKVYGAIDTVQVKKRVTYKAADGLDIPAYLTLPPGKEPKALPLVVLVHGGPAAYDTAKFDWWSQALADQGYAVLQPNYRGSDLQSDFLKAGYGEFGRKMQTDVSDGVRYLVKEGIADPARVCIVGASYGGYAALAGAALDAGVYRCAVSVAGISDLKRWLEWEGTGTRFDKTAVRYWDRFLGITGPHDPLVDMISPIKHIDAVRIPVLLIHGKDDTVVPYEQSTYMNDALRRAGKPVEMVTLAHEDHWLSRSQTRRQMLEESVRFLRAHNPP
jgi:dipeptidyl aminopeptidase/acylaminoacyl peptidase